MLNKQLYASSKCALLTLRSSNAALESGKSMMMSKSSFVLRDGEVSKSYKIKVDLTVGLQTSCTHGSLTVNRHFASILPPRQLLASISDHLRTTYNATYLSVLLEHKA